MLESNKNYPFEVRYVGAPYGLNEDGEIVSRHKTYANAVYACNNLQDNPRYYGDNSRIVHMSNTYREITDHIVYERSPGEYTEAVRYVSGKLFDLVKENEVIE